MKKIPERYRLRNTRFSSDGSYGNNGVFIIPHPKIALYDFLCQVSDGMPGIEWEHVSVSLKSKNKEVKRCPTWEEMCYIKSIFWEPEDAVVQFHPPDSQNVSLHPFCLHLWRPTNIELILPPTIAIGPDIAIKPAI